MKFIKLSVKEQRALTNQEYTNGRRFNPVMYNGYVIVSEEEVDNCTNANFTYLQSRVKVELSDMPIPNTTPPTMSGQGLMIPQSAVDANLFPSNKFSMNGFEINFTPKNGGLAIDIAYLTWNEFRAEQIGNPVNEDTKVTFTALWDTVAADYIFSLQNPSQSKIIQL